MTLHVYTARITSRDSDRLDITRKSANVFGLAFAPSDALVWPAIAKRRAGTFTTEDWTEYARRYIEEMERSYIEQRNAWNTLLMCRRVVAVCYCTDASQCHRTVLSRDILPRLGAVYGGVVAT